MWYGLISLAVGIVATIGFLVREFDGELFEVFLALTWGIYLAIGWPVFLVGGLIWLICYPFYYGFDFKKSLSLKR